MPVNQGLQAIAHEMYRYAQKRWPDLTWEEFRNIGLQIVAKRPSMSIGEMSEEIEQALVLLKGQGEMVYDP